MEKLSDVKVGDTLFIDNGYHLNKTLVTKRTKTLIHTNTLRWTLEGISVPRDPWSRVSLHKPSEDLLIRFRLQTIKYKFRKLLEKTEKCTTEEEIRDNIADFLYRFMNITIKNS